MRLVEWSCWSRDRAPVDVTPRFGANWQVRLSRVLLVVNI